MDNVIKLVLMELIKMKLIPLKINVNANTIILRCLQLGLSLSDFDNLTIGFLLDLVDENNREKTQSEEPIEADSDIINRFFK